MQARILAVAGIALTFAGIAVSAGGAYAYFWDRGRADVIAPGVLVAGIDVGGLHAAQARTLLAERLVRPLNRPVRVVHGGRSFLVWPDVAGLRVDVADMVEAAVRVSRGGSLGARLWRDLPGRPLRRSVPLRAALSHASLGGFVADIATVLDRPARAARVAATAAALRIVPSRAGVAVRRDSLLEALTRALLRHDGARTITVPTRVVHPRWTTANLGLRYPAFILVDRETFTLRLFKHLKLAHTYRIAVGRAGLETPGGLYDINDRQINPSWHVPKSPWAGDLAGRIIPPGPSDPIKARWLGFWNGAGIHGTTDVGSLGSAASHGCIRMAIPDVEALYPQVPLHTPIYVG